MGELHLFKFRVLKLAAFAGGYYLTDCTEYVDTNLGDKGKSINELAYERRFPRDVSQYYWPEVRATTPSQFLAQHWPLQNEYYSKCALSHTVKYWNATLSTLTKSMAYDSDMCHVSLAVWRFLIYDCFH